MDATLPWLRCRAATWLARFPDRLFAGTAADGVVVVAEVRGGYGNAVAIDHGNSLATFYAHTSVMLVKPGDLVARGDVIALVGSTGLSTGPHLHFETRLKGLPVDPEGVVDFTRPTDAAGYEELDLLERLGD